MDLARGDTRMIIDACIDHGLLRNQCAYVLATAYHETAHTMKPVREYGGEAYLRAKKYYPYVGMGYVQLTWKENYEKAGKRFGVDFVKHPKYLLKPEYANSVALAGDPRAANQAILSVYAAGLAATGGDAANAPQAGLEFFKKLNDAGNFVPVIGKAASLAQGTTPIIIRWDYNALADRDTLNGNPPVEVVVPKTGVVAGVYAQAISAYAPHPNAAKLWMEYIYSDEGQLGFLKGYCHPARFNQLVSEGKVPQDVLDKLPAAELYKSAVFPSLEEQDANKQAVTSGWDSVVGANVQ